MSSGTRSKSPRSLRAMTEGKTTEGPRADRRERLSDQVTGKEGRARVNLLGRAMSALRLTELLEPRRREAARFSGVANGGHSERGAHLVLERTAVALR